MAAASFNFSSFIIFFHPSHSHQIIKAMRGHQSRSEECFIGKKEAQEGNMRAKDQRRAKNNLGNGERISERSA